MSQTNAPVKTATGGAYGQFQTNKGMEKDGIVLDYGLYYIRIARAGGANQRYSKTLDHKFKPHRRAVQTETIDEKLAERLVRETYAESVVLGWGYKNSHEDKNFVDGKFLDENGDEMDFTQANVVKVFTDLPDLFSDVQAQAQKVSNFRDAVDEADAKN